MNDTRYYCTFCRKPYLANSGHSCSFGGSVAPQAPDPRDNQSEPPMTMKEIEERKEEKTSAFEQMLAEDFAEKMAVKIDVRHQNHYERFKIQPVVFIAENNLDFLTGNIIKYVLRHDAKDGVKDLEKAKHYLDMLIQKTRGEAVKP